LVKREIILLSCVNDKIILKSFLRFQKYIQKKKNVIYYIELIKHSFIQLLRERINIKILLYNYKYNINYKCGIYRIIKKYN